MAWSSGLQIRVLEGRDRGRVIPLDSPEMTLGRALDADETAPGWVLFAEPTVSRVHAVLHWDDGRSLFMLGHRSRTNPTLVDGKPVEQIQLLPGQRIQLGLLVFGVEVVEVRSGKLGDAVQAPAPRRPSLAGPVMEALNNLAEERAREPMAGMAGLADEVPGRARRGGKASVSGSIRLLAAQGPDQGTSFPLREPVLVIGRSLGRDDNRAGAGVLLNDPGLPSEQALLVWQDREFTYGILQAEGSPMPTRIRRVVSGRPKDVPVSTNVPTLLYEGDVIMMGQSSLVVRRAEPTILSGEEEEPTRPPASAPAPAPAPARPAAEPREGRRPLKPPPPPCTETEPPVGRRPGAAPAGEKAPTPPRRAPASPPPPEKESPAGRSPLRTWRGEEAPPQPSQESLRMRRSLPPRHLESIVENPEEGEAPPSGGIIPRGLPPHLERSLRGGRTSAEPVPLAPEPEDSEESEGPGDIPLFDPDALGNVTSAWKHRSDFVVGYLEGSRKGQKVALLASELSDERAITIGSPGTRVNDIEVDEADIANDHALLRYRGGRFTLVNFRSEIQVNNLTLGEGDQVVLMTGDRIQLGSTVLLFLERRVVEALRSFRLEVVDGVPADLGKVHELNKERLIIGRGRSCDIRLADPEVSRVHCVLVHRNERFYVQHRSETNPTFVNGISLLPGAERQVVPGDRIQVSSHSVLQLRTRGQ